FAAEDLGNQILDQTSRRVEAEIIRLLDGAVVPSRLSARRLQAGQFRVDDFPGVIRDWHEVLAVNPQLTSLFIGRQSDGASIGISRLRGERLTVWESSRIGETGNHQAQEYW